METCEEQTFLALEDESLYSAQECRASQRVLPGSEKAKQTIVGSGAQCSMLLDHSSLLGAFSKILLESPHFANSMEFCYVWQIWDTRLDFSAFQLTPLGQSTDGNGSSLWRTPNTSIVTGGGQDGEKRLEAGHAMQLSDQVLNPRLWPTPQASYPGQGDPTDPKRGAKLQTAAKLWPTPITNDARNGRNATANRNNPNSKHHDGTTLSDAAKLWPTLRKEGYDSQGKGHGDLQYEVKNRMLPTPRHDHSGLESHGVTAIGGSLNPRFVEELMGFPIDHTALKRSATLLSRNKPTRSSKRSRRSKGVLIILMEVD